MTSYIIIYDAYRIFFSIENEYLLSFSFARTHHRRHHVGVLSSAQWKISIKSVLTVQVTFPPLLVNSMVLHFFIYLTRRIKTEKKIHVHSFCIYIYLLYVYKAIVWFFTLCGYMLRACIFRG